MEEVMSEDVSMHSTHGCTNTSTKATTCRVTFYLGYVGYRWDRVRAGASKQTLKAQN